jgi:hypothetical protein
MKLNQSSIHWGMVASSDVIPLDITNVLCSQCHGEASELELDQEQGSVDQECLVRQRIQKVPQTTQSKSFCFHFSSNFSKETHDKTVNKFLQRRV